MVGRVLVERIGESVRHVMTDFPGKTEFRKLCQLVVLRENISSNTHSSAAAAVRIVNPRAFTTSFTCSHRSPALGDAVGPSIPDNDVRWQVPKRMDRRL
jgi:hypothetical protein